MTLPIRSLLVVVTTDSALLSADELNAISADEFEVRVVSDPETAALQASSPYLGAWIVHESIGDDAAARLFADLEEMRSDVPFVYVASEGEILSGFGTVLPDVVMRSPLDHVDLHARLNELWARDLFTDAIVEAVVDSVCSTVCDAFVDDAHLHALRIRAGTIPVHTVNSVIPFCGQAVAGRLSVSASAKTLAKVFDKLVPDSPRPTGRILEDLCGEMSNQVLGGLKRALGSGGIELASGVPMMYTSSSSPVRYRGRNGSLLLHLRSQNSSTTEVVVGFSLDSLRKAYEAGEEDDTECGALSFL